MALRTQVFSLLLLLVCSLLALSGAAPADDKGRLLRDGKPKVYVDLAAANATSRPENQTLTLHQNQTIGTAHNQSTPAAPMPPRTMNVTDNPRHHVRTLAKCDNKPKSPQDQQAQQQQQSEQVSQSFENATFPNVTTGAGTGIDEQRDGAQNQTAGGGVGGAGGGFGNATFPSATATGGQQQQRGAGGGGGGNATTSGGRAGGKRAYRLLAEVTGNPSGRPMPRGNTTTTGPGTTRPRTSNTTATAEEESGSRANTTSINRPRADRPPPPRTNVTSGPTMRGPSPNEPRDDPF